MESLVTCKMYAKSTPVLLSVAQTLARPVGRLGAMLVGVAKAAQRRVPAEAALLHEIHLGSPVERLEYGYQLLSGIDFTRGTLPQTSWY